MTEESADAKLWSAVVRECSTEAMTMGKEQT